MRGSSFLLFGRMLSVLINFATQVLTVRYLSKADFGAFSWAIAVISMGSTIALLSQHKALAHFLPIYLEQDDQPAQRGTILLAIGSTLGVGISIVAVTFALHGFLNDSFISDPLSIALLLILVTLVPLQGFDSLLHSVFAVLASPRAIFMRRHILSPMLRLAAVLGIIAIDGDVRGLAYGYLVAGLLGVTTYGLLLRKLLLSLHLIGPKSSPGVRVPSREMYRYGLPLLTTDLTWFLSTTVVILILESLWGTQGVAEYRAVVPLASLNLLILENVRLLYVPIASRLLARNDPASVDQLFARTSAWIAVMTFPVFAMCAFLPDFITVALFGDRYKSAAPILAVLATGQYLSAVLGVNLLTLNAFARVRFIAKANFVVAGVSLILLFALVPAMGPLGAGIATAATLVFNGLINQVGLIRLTPVGRLRGSHLAVLVAITGISIGLVFLRLATDNVLLLAVSIAVVSIGLLRWSRDTLHIADTFPELRKIPGMGLLLGK